MHEESLGAFRVAGIARMEKPMKSEEKKVEITKLPALESE